MVIREAGLLFRGFTLVKKSYHKSTLGKIDTDLRSGLLTAILNFAETAFSKDFIEYLESIRWMFSKWTIPFWRPFISGADYEMYKSFLLPLMNFLIERNKNIGYPIRCAEGINRFLFI